MRRTLASVLNQTFTDIEVILVDDASTDNSYEIIKSYEARDKRTRIFHKAENSSSLASRLTGAKQANGKYLLFLDSDDWLELDACEKLHNALLKNPVDALEFGYILEPNKEKQPFVKDFGNRFDALLNKDYPVTLWNKAYRTDLIKRAFDSFMPFYTTFAEDAFLSVVIACFAKSYGYVDEYLHHYSIATGISTQSNYSVEKIKQLVRDCKAVEVHLKDYIKENAN